MGRLASRCTAFKTLVESAVSGQTVAVLVGVDPDAEMLEGEEYAQFISIIPVSAPYSDNLLLNDVAQTSDWEWDLFIGVGSGGTEQDAIAQVDLLLELLLVGLQGQRLDADSSELTITERHEFHRWRDHAGGVIYRQGWKHFSQAEC